MSMKASFLVSLLITGTGFGQRLEVVSYDIESSVKGHYVRAHMDQQGRVQGPVVLYELSGSDTLFLFRGEVRNGYLVNTARWYADKMLVREAEFGYAPGNAHAHSETMGGWLWFSALQQGRDISWGLASSGYYKRSEEYYTDGRLEGVQRYYYPNGVEKEMSVYVSGMRSGPYTKRYSSGALQESGIYTDDRKTGKWELWNLHGKLAHTDWYGENEWPDSTWFYTEDGTVSDRVRTSAGGVSEYFVYANGSLDRHYFMKYRYLEGLYTRYYGNGNKLSEVEYRENQRNGAAQSWYEDGRLKEEYSYRNGLREGAYISWYPNGRLESKGQYSAGDKTGTWDYYHASGRRLTKSEIARIGEEFDVEPIPVPEVIEGPVEEEVYVSVEVLPQLKPRRSLSGRKAIREAGLGFTLRYKTIEVAAQLSAESAQAVYTVLTPMKGKNKTALEHYLRNDLTWTPLMINGRRLDCRLNLLLRFE